MKSKLHIFIVLLLIIPMNSCRHNEKTSDMNILYLHHSTGGVIWRGGKNSLFGKVARKVSPRLSDAIDKRAALPQLFKEYNRKHSTYYSIKEMEFPKETPYGWKNYPYDYYNIWIKNAGQEPFMEEPTLEMLTKEYQVIIFKHCFPVSNIKPDQDTVNISSEVRTISNYELQYQVLRDKLHEFPGTKFILFTGAVQVEANIKEEDAIRAREFFSWVTDEWDLPGDNIYIWDLYKLQTEGGLYFREDYAVSPSNSHPNKVFASRIVKLLFNRIIDIIENDGNGTSLTGETNNPL
jgi:hypothetical protein